MNIKEILAKVAKGEELTAEEKSFAEGYEDNSSELETLKAKQGKLEADLKEAQKKSKTLEQSAENAKREKMTADEKLQADLATAKAELEEAKASKEATEKEFSTLKRTNSINKLASDNKFKDVEYLDYLVAKANLDLSDDKAVKTFIDSAKKDTPQYFAVDKENGVPAPKPNPAPNGGGNGGYGGRIGTIAESIANANIITE